MKKPLLLLVGILMFSTVWSQRISELPPASIIYDKDLMVIVQNGVTKRITYDLVKGIQEVPVQLWSETGVNDITHDNTGYVKIKGKLQFDPLPPLALKVGRILTMTTDGKIEYARRLSIEPPDILPGILDHGLIPPHTVLVLNLIDSSVYSMPFDYFIDDDVYHAETASSVLTDQSMEIIDQSIIGVSTISSGSGMLFSNASLTTPFRFSGVPTKPNEIEIDSLLSASVLHPYYSVVVRDPFSNQILGTPFPDLKEAVLDALSYSDANCDLNMNSFNIYNPYSINLEGGMELLESEINNVSSISSTAGITFNNTSMDFPIRFSGINPVSFIIDDLPDQASAEIDDYGVMLRNFATGHIFESSINDLLSAANGSSGHGPITDPFDYFYVDQLDIKSLLSIKPASKPDDSPGNIYFDGDSLFLYAGSKWQALNRIGIEEESDPFFNAHKASLLVHSDTSSMLATRNWVTEQAYLTTGDNMGNMSATSDLDMNSHDINEADSISASSIIMTDPTAWLDQFRKRPFYYNEFLYGAGAQSDPWTGGALSSGTIGSYQVNSVDHPGIAALKNVAGSSGNNSGYQITTYNGSQYAIKGGEVTEFVVSFPVFDSVTVRLGWGDTWSNSDETDGIYFYLSGNSTVVGKTANNNIRSVTPGSFNASLNTYYRFKIAVNPDATRADFFIYNDSGTLLWSDYLTTNIPTINRLTGHHAIATKATTGSGGLSVNLLLIDYMMLCLGNLTR